MRKKKLNLLKFALPHNLAREFKEQMLMRNYNGSLVVDHTARIITITVETHKQNSNMLQDNNNNDDGDGDDDEEMQPKRNKRLANTNKRIIQDLKGKFKNFI